MPLIKRCAHHGSTGFLLLIFVVPQASNHLFQPPTPTSPHPSTLSPTNLPQNPDSDGDDDDNDSPDLADSVIKNAWDRTYRDEFLHNTNHHLLFGSPGGKVDLATLHPEQAKIFRLWQLYLDNVNPLLKVTHTPTLQSRIVDAFADLSALEPSLEALLFSIYCTSVLSLTDEQCRAIFGSPRHEVLSGYQFACRQALVNCNALGSSDHDCLTAMFLYLVINNHFIAGYKMLICLLTRSPPDLNPAGNRSPLPLVDARRPDPHRTAPRLPQRVLQFPVPAPRGRDAPSPVVVAGRF